MILPERTFDIWVALAVARRFPSSLLWAPTTNAQAYREPWDLEMDVALGSERSKAFFFENKGVDSSWNINIDTIQLANLIFENEKKAKKTEKKAKKTIWYALPCFDKVPEPQRREHIRKLQNDIGTKSRVFEPLQIRVIIRGQISGTIQEWREWHRLNRNRRRKDWTEFPSALRAKIRMDHILHCTKAPTLNDFLDGVDECKFGKAYRNNTTMSVMQDIADRIKKRMSYQDVMRAWTTESPNNGDSEWDEEELMGLARQLDREGGPESLPQFFQIPMSSIIPSAPQP